MKKSVFINVSEIKFKRWDKYVIYSIEDQISELKDQKPCFLTQKDMAILRIIE